MKTITCVNCGTSAKRYGNGAKFCLPCAHAPRERIAAPGRVRNGVYKPLIVNGLPRCLECGVVCGTNVARRLRCGTCAKARYLALTLPRHKASAAVSKAIRTGALKKPTEFACADCARPAECYDHRDYSKPLQVDPVCRSCNVMRGPALCEAA